MSLMKLLPPFIALLIALPAAANAANADARSTSQTAPTTSNKDEKTQVLTALEKNASSHNNQTAGKIYRSNGKRLLLEMRGIVVHKLIHGSVAIEEREVGETRRIFV